MSRRPPNPVAERAAQNQQTIKSLLKLEANKVCADCKRNKHPRWASWNIGVFICIRCSGIHRGMGTHISRVKSVDLDSWTDEQLQSILGWGNARANKYWEAKLAPGHVPSEAKIENFIRTKYELKRWVSDPNRPDPHTLDVDGDDEIPLSVVKEKQNVARRESLRKASLGQSTAPTQADLIGDLISAPPSSSPQPAPRASSAAPARTALPRPPGKADPAPPKATSTKDSLLGLDFLGATTVPPPRPASTTGTSGTGGTSRPDLKQSILSLYATAPKPQQPQAQPPRQQAFGGAMQPPTSPSALTPQQSFGGLDNSFSSLSFNNNGSTTSPAAKPKDPFANLTNFSGGRKGSRNGSTSAFSGLSGGSFFDTKPAFSPPAQPRGSLGGGGGGGGGLGNFGSATPTVPPAASQTSSAMGDLFDLSDPAPVSTLAPVKPSPITTTTASSNSVFDLSAPAPTPSAKLAVESATTSTPAATVNAAPWGDSNVWGANAWAEPAKKAPEPAKISSPPATSTMSPVGGRTSASLSNDFGWGSSASKGGGLLSHNTASSAAVGKTNSQPKVTADEEFGGWASSAGPVKPVAGLSANEDLFSNVWQ